MEEQKRRDAAAAAAAAAASSNRRNGRLGSASSRPSSDHESSLVFGILVGAAAGILVLSALVAAALYRKFCWYKSIHSINFDNPVYRKTVEGGSNAAVNASNGEVGSVCSRSGVSGVGSDQTMSMSLSLAPSSNPTYSSGFTLYTQGAPGSRQGQYPQRVQGRGVRAASRALRERNKAANEALMQQHRNSNGNGNCNNSSSGATSSSASSGYGLLPSNK